MNRLLKYTFGRSLDQNLQWAFLIKRTRGFFGGWKHIEILEDDKKALEGLYQKYKKKADDENHD